jgi:muconate cycloisomerase
MEIRRIEVIQIETPRYYGHISGHVLVKVHVDDGPVGWGEASDYRVDSAAATAARYHELLVGRDARQITQINELLRRQVTPHLASAIDLALYDLNGKAQNVPAYQLLGGKVRERLYVCYPIFGWQVQEDYERAMSYLERLRDLGHHLFRFYVSGDSDLDDRFLSDVARRFDGQLKLKSLDFSWRFHDWQEAVRYGDRLRRHEPYHFEAPSKDLRQSAEFTRRVDLPTTWHIHDLSTAQQAIDAGACNAFNLACVSGGPSHIRRLFAVAEAAGCKCLIGTDQESTLGLSAQVAVGITVPNLDLPCDPMGSVLYTATPARQQIRTEGSYLYPFEAPGLGVEIDAAKLRDLTRDAA